MLDKNQEQSQTQNIVTENHGIVDRVHCPYYTDERVDHCDEFKHHGEKSEAVKNKDMYFDCRYVSRIIYQGKVTDVSCHLLDKASKKCSSKLNKKENKECHLL